MTITRDHIRVLLVMGEALAGLVAATLRHGRYDISVVRTEVDLRRGLPAAELVLVDIDHFDPMLDLMRAISDATPLIAFTRRRSTAAKLRAFERGADDVVEVPFTLDEIIARPYALLRRARGIKPQLASRIRLNSHLEVDLLAQTVTLDGGRTLELTPIQQTLLYILAANAGNVLTRETLLATIWGNDFQIESNVVDRHIRELRVKLGDDWKSARYLETVAGKGYRFREAHEPALSGHPA